MDKIFEIEKEMCCPFGENVESDFAYLMDECRRNIDNFDETKISEAFWLCVDAHKDQPRSTGDPYYTHPMKVALLLLNEFNVNDNSTIIAALLHDTLEDTWVTFENLAERFSTDIANLVEGVTKIKTPKDDIADKDDRYKISLMDKAATYTKLFTGLVRDVRIILVKLADRIDNLRTLYALPERKRISIAKETMNFYTPFAQRLGLKKIKGYLEDLSLSYFNEAAYMDIKPALARKRAEFIEYIRFFYEQLTTLLIERKIEHVITIEHKHVYEIYTMMHEQGKRIEDIDNFYSMVIILPTEDITECYRVYGLISSVFGPVSSLEDYIARPKINIYRALHSTHYGPGRRLVEVVIRTEAMEKVAECGIANIFPLKSGSAELEMNEPGRDEWVQWMNDIIEDGDADAVQRIWGSIKKNLYEDRIHIYSEDGRVFNMPVGACSVDFAFSLSVATGLHCLSAKVNGEIKQLDYELKDRDVVEIITSSKAVPAYEWSDFVITHRAVVSLYNYFKQNNIQIQNKAYVEHPQLAKLRITGEDRPQLLHDITIGIGTNNIQRINLSTVDSVFEAAFTISMNSRSELNALFTKLLTIRGIKGIEQIEED